MFCDYTAGWISGVFSLIIGHPLDTIKIQQQIRGITFKEATHRIRSYRGWKGYYRGLLVPLMSTGMLNAIFFGLYGDIRDYLTTARIKKEGLWGQWHSTPEDDHPVHKKSLFEDPSTIDVVEDHKDVDESTFFELFIAGSIAGTVCLTLAAPVELVKTKLQSQMKRSAFHGPLDCFVTVFKEAGFRGIYRGMVPMIYRDGPPGGGVCMIAYEGFRRKFDTGDDSFWNQAVVPCLGGGLAGSIVNYFVVCKVLHLCSPGLFPVDHDQVIFAHTAAGCAAWALVLPFDVVKSRMQADHHLRPHYRGMMHCTKEIFRNEGMHGLYRGFWSCAVRSIPVNASIFVVYEYIQSHLCRRHDHH